MKIALDGMGGDFAPKNNIEGAINALNNPELEILLVGIQEELEQQLSNYDFDKQRITVIPSEGAIADSEQPAIAVKRKVNASINVCSGLVKKGVASGFLSCGNSGATFASATGMFGLFEGLRKPCVGAAIFGFAPETLILDLGLNVDPTPNQLVDFAALGVSQVKIIYGIEDPTVALLSNGSESNKGNRLIKESFELFHKSNLNFKGNIEGHDIASGKVNVVVCDGFTGNILLKLIEGIGNEIFSYLRREIKDQKYEQIIQNISNKTNLMREFGGGPIIGINGIAVIGHGASSPKAISNGINSVERLANKDYINQSKNELIKLRKSFL
ncbi:MAG: phosphate acyltransferase PlsX [Dehalococcoidia bacterium]|nr:phosphate acyltransferase PlsX [Dehalococcoidia bacterium]|tara:strand:+ start:344 stop:1327 length:984 start_codon:yes stop_codon:yes gene_type:complete